MCLAIPMQIIEINGFVARCEAMGVQREISLFMLQDQEIAVDDFVIVNLGYAVQKVSEQDARSSWELFNEIIDSTESGPV